MIALLCAVVVCALVLSPLLVILAVGALEFWLPFPVLFTLLVSSSPVLVCLLQLPPLLSSLVIAFFDFVFFLCAVVWFLFVLLFVLLRLGGNPTKNLYFSAAANVFLAN